MDAPVALYRRYRPETYAEIIGQDHVTEPLRQALRNNRVNHAYLFSGPRGCGKTTSARILARCLNCDQGPTPDPCDECTSCRDLARGGGGSIDVIEIDAASHGGVDDARELRERAFFSPVSARYKIYIVDEAHMVTTQGFNALLKLVEEPPEHLKFIFATTEPDKVIGTIRSRTHHYPFRLVPPKLLQDYLTQLCAQEKVQIEPAALPLVVRAGGGSVRDTLSVLDQLLGGAGQDGVTYPHAVGLLGYTPDALLDEVVDALAARDGGAVFAAIDRVIESGQDPRRFSEDLLQRLRDLIVVAAVPDAASRGLLEAPADHAERLSAQAASLGRAELTRAADIVATALTAMRGATAPRLHLELMCARVLLPGVDDSAEGLHARLDRLERRASVMPPAGSAPAAASATPAAPAPTEAPPSTADEPARDQPDQPQPDQPQPDQPQPDQPQPAPSPEEPAASPADTPAAEPPTTMPPSDTPAASTPAEPAEPTPSAPATPPTDPAPANAGELGLAEVRQLWPDVLEAVKGRRRFTWIMLSQNAQVTDVRGGTLTIALVNAGARESFLRSKSDELLQQALADVLGVNWRVEAIVDPSTGSGSDGGGGTTRPPGAPGDALTSRTHDEPTPEPTPEPVPAAAEWPTPRSTPDSAPEPASEPSDHEAADRSTPVTPSEPASSVEPRVPSRPAPSAPSVDPASVDPASRDPASSTTTDPADTTTRANPTTGAGVNGTGMVTHPDPPPPAEEPAPFTGNPDDEVDPDDQPYSEATPSQTDLLIRELGAQVIEERDGR